MIVHSIICSFDHTFERSFDCLIKRSNRRHDGNRTLPEYRIRPGRDARGTAAAERFPLPEGAGRGSLPAQGCRGLKALGRGSGKGHPGGRVQRGEATPLVRVVGGKAPCLNRAKCSVPTEWMRWRSQYFALLSYGKFLNLLFRASGVTDPITPVHRDLFGNGFVPSCHSALSEGPAFDSFHQRWTVGLVSPVSRAHRDLFLQPGCCSCHSRTIDSTDFLPFPLRHVPSG